jgi:hypothetical protein
MLKAGSLRSPDKKAKGRAHFPCAAFEICAFGALADRDFAGLYLLRFGQPERENPLLDMR